MTLQVTRGDQHAKKVVSNSPGLVDFANEVVNRVINLPKMQANEVF